MGEVLVSVKCHNRQKMTFVIVTEKRFDVILYKKHRFPIVCVESGRCRGRAGIMQAFIVSSPSRCKCRIDVLFITAQKIKRAATRYHKIKTMRLEREFFVPASTSIAALTPARLIHKSSLHDTCPPPAPPGFHSKLRENLLDI